MPAAIPSDSDDHDGGALGALPLALGTGTGSELRRPLGITIVGGLIVSQMLTLYTTPVVYLYLDRMRLRWANRRSRRGIAAAPQENLDDCFEYESSWNCSYDEKCKKKRMATAVLVAALDL